MSAVIETCKKCGQTYDATDPAAQKYHTEGIDCGTCRRCSGAPRCYMCTSSFCVCGAH